MVISSENMVVLITIGDPFSCLLFSQTESMKRCQTCGWQCTQTQVVIQERERVVKCEDLNDSSSSTPHKLEMMEDNSQKLKISFFLVVFIGKPGLVLTHVARLANEYHQEINNEEFYVPKQVSMEKWGEFLFYIYYLIIYEKYLVLYILQVLSHHNY